MRKLLITLTSIKKLEVTVVDEDKIILQQRCSQIEKIEPVVDTKKHQQSRFRRSNRIAVGGSH